MVQSTSNKKLSWDMGRSREIIISDILDKSTEFDN